MKNRKCFITGIKGSRLTKQELIFLKRYKPWGIILFSRNLQNIDYWSNDAWATFSFENNAKKITSKNRTVRAVRHSYFK